MRIWTADACADAGPGRLYDRWPWLHLALAGLLVGGAAVTWPWALEHPRWLWFFFLAIPVLVLHQFEEFVLPGGFTPWFNTHLFRSGNPYFPLHKQQAALNHLPLLILFPILAVLGSRWPFVGLGGLLGLFADGVLHVTAVAATGRYAPGAVTAVVLYLPLGFSATHYFVRTGEVSLAGLLVSGFAAVLILNALVFLPPRVLARRHPLMLEAAPRVAPPS